MKRLFIAIKLSAEIKEALTDAIEQLHTEGVRGRYENVANLHITLAFIGETDRLEDVKKAVSEIQFNPFKIELTNIGNFRRQILWMGLSNEDRLRALADTVRRKLSDHGIEYASTPFKAHITLVKDASNCNPEIDVLHPAMTVEHISVMETAYPQGRRTYIELYTHGA